MQWNEENKLQLWFPLHFREQLSKKFGLRPKCQSQFFQLFSLYLLIILGEHRKFI